MDTSIDLLVVDMAVPVWDLIISFCLPKFKYTLCTSGIKLDVLSFKIAKTGTNSQPSGLYKPLYMVVS